MGASAKDIIKAVTGRLGLAVALGIVIGIIVSKQLLALARQLLFGVDLLDPSVLLLTIGTILLVAFVAAMIPAFRAISTDPATALRTE